MSDDRTELYERVRAASCKLLGFDVEKLTDAQALQVDLATILRLNIDDMTAMTISGKQVDVVKLACLPRAASSETSAVTRNLVGGSNAPVKPAAEPASQPMNTEKTNGESTPPAITSFSPARRGASSPRKCSPMGWPLTIVPSVLRRSRT